MPRLYHCGRNNIAKRTIIRADRFPLKQELPVTYGLRDRPLKLLWPSARFANIWVIAKNYDRVILNEHFDGIAPAS